MDRDKELIEKIGRILNGCSCSICTLNADKAIALVREHDGPRWERLHSASKNTRAWLSRNGLEGISAYDDLVSALDAIPQSEEPPTPAAEPRYTMDHITWRAITEMCSVEQVNAISGRVLQLRWEQNGGAQ